MTPRASKYVYTLQPVEQLVVQPAGRNVLSISFHQTRHIVYCPHSRLTVTQWRHKRPRWTAQATLGWAHLHSSSNHLYNRLYNRLQTPCHRHTIYWLQFASSVHLLWTSLTTQKQDELRSWPSRLRSWWVLWPHLAPHCSVSCCWSLQWMQFRSTCRCIQKHERPVDPILDLRTRCHPPRQGSCNRYLTNLLQKITVRIWLYSWSNYEVCTE